MSRSLRWAGVGEFSDPRIGVTRTLMPGQEDLVQSEAARAPGLPADADGSGTAGGELRRHCGGARPSAVRGRRRLCQLSQRTELHRRADPTQPRGSGQETIATRLELRPRCIARLHCARSQLIRRTFTTAAQHRWKSWSEATTTRCPLGLDAAEAVRLGRIPEVALIGGTGCPAAVPRLRTPGDTAADTGLLVGSRSFDRLFRAAADGPDPVGHGAVV